MRQLSDRARLVVLAALLLGTTGAIVAGLLIAGSGERLTLFEFSGTGPGRTAAFELPSDGSFFVCWRFPESPVGVTIDIRVRDAQTDEVMSRARTAGSAEGVR